MKTIVSIFFTIALLFSSFSSSVFANNDGNDMNMNEGDQNYGEGPMNINEEDGPLRVNDNDEDPVRISQTADTGDDNNWEWLGLLGFLGLLGLRGRDRREATR